MGLQKKRQFLLTETVVSFLLKHLVRKNRSNAIRSRNQLSQGISDPQTLENKLDCLVLEILFIHELTPLL